MPGKIGRDRFLSRLCIYVSEPPEEKLKICITHLVTHLGSGPAPCRKNKSMLDSVPTWLVSGYEAREVYRAEVRRAVGHKKVPKLL